MASIISDKFSITVNRHETPPDSTTGINSNKFSISVNRHETPPQIGSDGKSSQIVVYKGITRLTPVSGTPTTGQYKISITTENCTAGIKDDNCTVYIKSISASTGRVIILVNVENIHTYTKYLTVEKIIDENEVTTMKEEMSTIEQTANKIHWLVKNGTSSSNMELTADAYNVISKNINLTADHIELEGYTTINGGFLVDTDGNMSCTNANVSGTVTGSIISGSEVTGDSFNVEGTLTAEKIECSEILSPKYPGVVTEDLKLYVSTSGDDDAELVGRAIFASFDGLLDKLPKNLNGHEVRIQMKTDMTENVEFVGYHGGRIRIYTNGHTLNGYVSSRMGSARIYIHSGYIGNANDTSNGWGKIHPSKGYAIGTHTASIAIEDSGNISLYNIDVYAADKYLSGSKSKVGIASSTYGTVYMNGVSFYGCDIGARANAGGRIHDTISYNVCAKYGWLATTGGYITLAGNCHSGGKTDNFQESDGGKVIIGGDATFVGGDVQVPSVSAPVPPTTKTLTVKSISGDTYRSSVYNSWKKDNTVRQGEWQNYGDCNGCWFFGSDAFEDVQGKTITKVTIKITRQTGNGSSSAVGLVVRTHNYGSRPSGNPTLSSSSCGTLSLAWGQSGTLTITDSTVLQGISKGTIKGFGIKTTYDSAHYAVCSGSVTVKVTYKE